MTFPKILASVTALFSTLLLGFAAFAQESGVSSAFGQEGAYPAAGGLDLSSIKWIVAGVTICIAITACSIAQSRAIVATVEGIARNPGAQNKMFMPMILGLAMIESLAIYGLVVSLLLLF